MRTPRKVRLAMYEVIPNWAIPVKCPVSMTIEVDVVSSKNEGRGLVLVSNGKGMI